MRGGGGGGGGGGCYVCVKIENQGTTNLCSHCKYDFFRGMGRVSSQVIN